MDVATTSKGRTQLAPENLRSKKELIECIISKEEKKRNEEQEENIEKSSEETTDKNERRKDSFKSNKGYKILTFEYPESIVGKDGYKWEKKPFNKPKHTKNIYKSNIFDEAINVKTPLDSWSLLFTNHMITKIVEYTNEKIKQHPKFSNESSSNYNETNNAEIKMIIALFYLRGLYKITKFKENVLWIRGFTTVHFHAIPLERFGFLVECLRFNSITQRNEKEDTLAAIQGIWDMFISNCQKYYSPSQNCSIDEQILDFYGKCPFLVQMNKKPDKQGLKIVMMNDEETGYMINAMLYTGRFGVNQMENKPDFYVETVSQPIHRSGRTITVGKWFMSKSLMETMLTQYSLTMVGCVKKSDPVIPSIFTKVYEAKTARVVYDERYMLVSYTPRIGKIILILSSTQDYSIDRTTSKPTVLLKYHETKKGTQFFNSVCRSSSVGTQTEYWPLRLFYAMLDQACLNSFILYNINNANKEIVYKDFIYHVLEKLVKPFYLTQLNNVTLRKSLRNCLGSIINETALQTQQNNKLSTRELCHHCNLNHEYELTDICCIRCRQPVCNKHKYFACSLCA